ncbi:bifunctional 2-polyprenyl-6-hydroxyphenol methylase/3-demethylubiquinol 3-O-methyltransferase UbiG [Phaeovibrio sulfidiphilus]|uniref:Ubiquinone biosynthesis O-methyltransferase n=1 Tax=Phaeovibrio sulfidiphilus TaxID=1220600 RepID=A0A8J6YNN0_9PROT|nr:bifunctional 2-polyprenyl-6-hydroxyphenol methylase/3-demethylubiquinol 3-O-methyltransferase UbiG [Phaeovibrio sulfidiphilus]MBE1237104.1 bifunctional 2-polyprenyl-6-hydroxyphenol methylase/3-demethylubiquinol 3-O-methyltransferase UbiG [Phaeovibrio sulfidiphilus]
MTDSPQTTASQAELAKFQAMADAWWDPKGKFRPLHDFNPVRLDFLREKLLQHFGRDRSVDRPFEGLTLLDIGCGGGLLAEPLAEMGFTVTGIDAVAKNIGTARAHADKSGVPVEYRVARPEELVSEGVTFDVVLAMEVLEHVADVDLFLQTLSDLMRPGGALAMATINRTVRAAVFAKFAAEYILRWMPPGTHDWNKFIKPSELAADLRRYGLEARSVEGVSFNPLGATWRRSSDVSMNYLMFAVKG